LPESIEGYGKAKDGFATESTEEHGRKRLNDFLATKSTKEHEIKKQHLCVFNQFFVFFRGFRGQIVFIFCFFPCSSVDSVAKQYLFLFWLFRG